MRRVKEKGKKISMVLLSCVLTVGMMPELPGEIEAKAADADFNYGEALQKSLIFYELQKSGKLDGAEFNRNNWRGDSCLKDGQDNNVDLTGGWFDAGDNAKFNLPMSYTATMLAWSFDEFQDSYDTSGQTKYLLNELKWANDYFIKCHPEENVYYYQVGNGNQDHAFWGSAEVVETKMERPSYKVDNTEANGGSAVCGETAAALASCAVAFSKDSPYKDTAYAEKCIKYAKSLYKMAEDAKSDKGYTEANGFYNSWSGFYDELAWAGMWIYKATGDKTYLEKAEEYAMHFGSESQGSDELKYSYTQCWDDVHIGAAFLIEHCDEASAEAKERYKKLLENNMDFWFGDLKGKGSDQITYTEGGLAWMSQWGSIRYATTAAFMASLYAKWWGDTDSERGAKCKKFAKQQGDYALGSTGRSFQIGFGKDYPQSPHHRTAHGAWGDSLKTDPDKTRHVLVGAVVGGPQKADDSSYEDDRGNYYSNEVACDYNAGFTGLMAALYEDYPSTVDPSVNAVETVPQGEEYYANAAINASDSTNAINFVEFKAIVYNHTAWPARVAKNLKLRCYVDISSANADPSEFTVSCNYSQSGVEPSQLKPYDAANGIYYTEIDFTDAKDPIYPGGQSQSRSEIQFRIAAPGKWDFSTSPSVKGLEGTSNNDMVKAENMALYDGDVLVYGQEPDGTKPDPTQPTTKVDETTVAPTTEAITETTTVAPTEEVTTETTTAAPTEEATTETTTAAPTEEVTTETTTAAPTTQESTTEPTEIVTGDNTISATDFETTSEGVTTETTMEATSEIITGDNTIPVTDFGETTSSINESSTNETESEPSESRTEQITSGEEETTEKNNKPRITIGTIALLVGGDQQIPYEPKDVSGVQYVWLSSDESVASVTDEGVVIGKKAGVATITLIANGEISTCVVTVRDKDFENPTTTEQEETTTQLGQTTTKPEETTQPRPTRPGETTQPSQVTTKPEETTQPRPTRPGETTQPSQATTKPEETTQPRPTRPGETTQPEETTQPGQVTTKPEETTQPGQATTKPEETTQPGQVTTKPEETTQPRPTRPGETTQPGQATTKPEETTQPDDTTNATESTTGASQQPTTNVTEQTTEASQKPATKPTEAPKQTEKNVTDIVVASDSISLAVGKKQEVQAIAFPLDASNRTLRYVSKNTKIATVNANGVVQAKKAGRTIIQVIAASGIVKNVRVTVKPATVTGLKKKNVTKKTAKLSWKKQKGISGYKIYKYDTKSKKYRLYKKTKKNSIQLKSLKRRTTYQFKVRAYRSNLVSNWSKRVTVRTK